MQYFLTINFQRSPLFITIVICKINENIKCSTPKHYIIKYIVLNKSLSYFFYINYIYYRFVS